MQSFPQSYRRSQDEIYWIMLNMEDFPGVRGKSTAQMQDINTFLDAGWDFEGESANGEEDIWFMPENGYPKLAGSAGSTSGSNPADMNEDGYVDILDFAIFSENWLIAD
ncbi:hypothetical protein [Sedimentisphaera cyanobacteriorum]|nr:hypothetical protein [Sedimentisphaera cyanobacteriorum]